MKKICKLAMLVVLGALTLTGCASQSAPAPTPAPAATANTADLQKQIDDIKGTIPKFAVVMREIGDRFENMNAAAKGGNWGLAAYMSSYMNKAMNPAKVTKPAEYPMWESFYTKSFKPVNDAIAAKDYAAFDKAYTAVIDNCNGCHASIGYKFIKIVKKDAAANTHVDYTLESEPSDLK